MKLMEYLFYLSLGYLHYENIYLFSFLSSPKHGCILISDYQKYIYLNSNMNMKKIYLTRKKINASYYYFCFAFVKQIFLWFRLTSNLQGGHLCRRIVSRNGKEWQRQHIYSLKKLKFCTIFLLFIHLHMDIYNDFMCLVLWNQTYMW